MCGCLDFEEEGADLHGAMFSFLLLRVRARMKGGQLMPQKRTLTRFVSVLVTPPSVRVFFRPPRAHVRRNAREQGTGSRLLRRTRPSLFVCGRACMHIAFGL